jgi:hypothetical protein
MHMTSFGVATLSVLVPLAVAVSCSSDQGGFSNAPAPTSTGTGIAGPDLGPPPVQGLGNPDASADVSVTPPSVGNLSGRVYAPNGKTPIAGALVYLTDTPPPPISPNAYCDKCIDLDSPAFGYTKADGTFQIPAYSTGSQYLVTRKGQFRRVRKVEVKAGNQVVERELTQFPSRTNAGLMDTIPRFLVAEAAWDDVGKALKKLGIQDFITKSGLEMLDILKDASKLSQYHVVFLPCDGTANLGGDQAGPVCKPRFPDSGQRSALKQYVQAGGKVYATDWSYLYVQLPWPGFVEFVGENPNVYGSACQSGGGKGPAKFDDPGLNAWMSAQGEQNAELEGNWVLIKRLKSQQGIDENGQPKTITPKLWASQGVGASATPATISIQDKCGQVLYSTYHTEEGFGSDLNAQEKALMHTLLEVSGCVGPSKPPPPPN